MSLNENSTIEIIIKNKIATKIEQTLSISNLLENIKENDYPVFYEVIRGECRGYADIDFKVDNKEILVVERLNIIREIKEKLIDYEYDLFDSCGKDKVKNIWKISFHIIFNLKFNCGKSCESFVKKLNLPHIDLSVYKPADKMQLMRLPYCVKEGDKRVLRKVNLETFKCKTFKSVEKIYKNFIIKNVEGCSTWEEKDELFSDSEDEEPDLESDAEEPDLESDAEEKNMILDVKKKYTIQKIQDLVKLYPIENQDWDWEEWRNWMFALKNVALENEIDLRPLAHEISKCSEKYDEKATDEIYDVQGVSGKKITIGSIIFWIKQVNPQGLAQWYESLKEAKSDEEILVKSPFTDGDIADYFCKRYNNEFIFFDGELYNFNDVYWKNCEIGKIYKYLNNIYFELLDFIKDKYSGEDDRYLYDDCLKKMLVLRKTKMLVNAWGSIKFRIEIRDDIFDVNPYLLGFTNGTYDLNLDEFRKGNKLDYISLVVPYDYEKIDDLTMAYDFINKVMPIEDERDFLLKTLSTCLDGKLLENFIFHLGNGRNGKDTLCTSIMKAVLGEDLYYEAPNNILTENLKTGANPEVANMHKKRMVIFNEPKKTSTLNCATVKQLTGCENMPVRNLYKSNNKTRICATMQSLLNKLLPMDSPDDAMLNRLFVIPFRAMFRKEEDLAELPEDTKYAYVVDSYYKSSEFLDSIKMMMMNILLAYYKIFRNEGRILKNAPKSIRDASKQYLSDSDEFVGWFKDIYEITNSENDYIKMKDIYDRFKCSDLWNNMNKAERRKMNKSKLEADIRESPTLRSFYKTRYSNNNDIDVRNVMIKFKLRIIVEDDEEDNTNE